MLLFSTDTDDAHTVLILAEEELVAIDLLSDGWPCYELPYLSSIHASAILSATHVANVPQALWDRIKAAGVSQRTICSTRVSLSAACLHHNSLMSMIRVMCVEPVIRSALDTRWPQSK